MSSRRHALRRMIRAAALASVGGFSVLPPSVGAQTAAGGAPDAPVVLRVGGAIGRPTHDQEARFTMAMLRALPMHTVVAVTPWAQGPQRYAGPLLRDVLAQAQARGTMLHATALNDYSVDIPMSDALDLDTIVALELDGRPMSVREKGPLFVMYPFDARPELRTAVYYSRCIWQLRALHVR